jgi:hypothetical protein
MTEKPVTKSALSRSLYSLENICNKRWNHIPLIDDVS